MTNQLLKLNSRILSVALISLICPSTTANAAPLPGSNEARKEALSAMAHMTKWSAPDKGISLRYPSNWESEGAKGKYQLLAFKTWKGLVSGHLMVAKVGPKATLEKIAILTKEVPVLGKKCPTTLVSRSQIQIGKQPAVLTIYKYTMPVTVPYERRVAELTMLKDGTEYLLNFGSPASIYDEFDGCRKQIFDSVQLN